MAPAYGTPRNGLRNAALRPKRNTHLVHVWRLIALVAVSLLVGCGGSDDDEAPPADDPRAVVTRYMEALEAVDVATACEVIQVEYQLKPERCQAGLVRAFEKEDIPDFDADTDIGEVSFYGDGTARVDNLANGGYWDLVKQDGEWRLQLSD
jgi:hypothetical protein